MVGKGSIMTLDEAILYIESIERPVTLYKRKLGGWVLRVGTNELQAHGDTIQDCVKHLIENMRDT